MQFPHIKMIYPNAPLQPYTPAGGEVRKACFFLVLLYNYIYSTRNRMCGSIGKLLNHQPGNHANQWQRFMKVSRN